ncbi:hypothetical protein [Rhodococcus sp. SGAir0479]|uniref:hypothetical protein n=1 Tax=Rhodococcus sp. SGAir0479 TaxID=2567884 RepID=UPI0010CCBA3F|nr:hypothetical protein [Rhodococcus sp. SGAir0479]QCQ90476.1 hypothetical protein E7742_04045 [Rhodococcus sp. SGAir0479]
MAHELTDFLDPTDTALAEAWRSVLARTDPGGARQVNFIPCEVVLCLCATRVVDHSRFGSGSADRAPFPVPQLARLFKRPNSSILAKMANLDGSRPNGGRHDRAVHDCLVGDPDALDALYLRILRAARLQGIGPDLLPDFLGLVASDESGDPVESGDGDQEDAESTRLIRWFRGLDGQVIVDRTHVWITRENVEAFAFATEPRRAPLTAVRACRLLPSRADGAGGMVHVLVDGADELPADCVSHPDAVVFGVGQERDFEDLAAMLASPADATEESTTSAFLAALDRMENIATAQEILDAVLEERGRNQDEDAVAKLADELDELDDDPRVTWAWVGETWVAAGGLHAGGTTDSVELLRAMSLLVDTLPGDTGVAALCAAAADTPLAGISTWRLSELWEALCADRGDNESAKPEPAKREQAEGERRAAPAGAIREPQVPAPPRRGSTDSSSASPRPARTMPQVPARPMNRPATQDRIAPASRAVPSLVPPAANRSAAVGSRWRVFLDCAGFRTVAVCDPQTGVIEISKGELKGRRFPNPTLAAAAVVERHEPGALPPDDGWTAWIVDDGRGRTLGTVRKMDGTAADTPGVSAPRSVAAPVDAALVAAATSPTAERGITWFIEQVRNRGGEASRVTGTLRTAVRVVIPGCAPVVVRVKTRTGGTWQATKKDENLRTDDTGAKFWAFVDLSVAPTEVFILPAAEVAAGIRRATDAWIARDPSRRRTGHHAIELARIAHGRGRWDLLTSPD